MASPHAIEMFGREWWPNVMCEFGLLEPEMTKWWQTFHKHKPALVADFRIVVHISYRERYIR